MMWRLSEFGENVAVIEENGREISYSELSSLSEKLRGYFESRCLVFNFCSNTLGCLLGYLTFINNKIVTLMVDSLLDRDLSNNLIKTYQPKYLWLPKDKAKLFSKYETVCEIVGYCLIKTDFTCCYNLNENLALLLTTSGSTGSFKLVRQSYKNIISNTNSIIKYLKLDSSQRSISTLPMHYTYGLSIVNTHLKVGASLVLTEKTLMQREFWKQLKDFRVTSFGGVPYTYEMLDKLRFFRMDLPYLQTMTQAGGRLSLNLHKKFAEYALKSGKNFVVMYGQTEATARMSYLPPEKSLTKAGSIGIAIPGGEFSLVGENLEPITEPGTEGELIYRGENVTLGYAKCVDDLAKGDQRNGVLKTGDMAKFDEDGFYYIVGRKKRFLKIFGSRVNLDETEQLLRLEFEDIDCACCGVDDRMYIFINKQEKIDDVLKFISSKMSLHHFAFKVLHIEKIPRSESGKILYPALEGYYDKL